MLDVGCLATHLTSMNLTGFTVYPSDGDDDGILFWTAVNWCMGRGASDFSVSGANGFEPGIAAEVALHARLAPFAISVQRRRYSDGFDFVEGDIPIWSLNSASLQVLRDSDIEIPIGLLRAQAESQDVIPQRAASESQSVNGGEVRIAVPSKRNGPPIVYWKYEMFLCIYKGGIPMLGVFSEQFNELFLVITDDDLVHFERLGLDASYDRIPNFCF